MRKLMGLLVGLLCLALAVPAMGAGVEYPPLTIASDGEVATFTLAVEGLPEMFELGLSSSQEGELEYAYEITFFDGERGYSVGVMEMKFGGNPSRKVPFEGLWNALSVIDGEYNNYVMQCPVAVEGDVITWTLALPVVDGDGNEYPMDLEHITAFAYTVVNIATEQNERGYFQVLEDGTVEEIDFEAFGKIAR